MEKPRPLSNTKIKNARPTGRLRTLYDGDGLVPKITLQGFKLWCFLYPHPHIKQRRKLRQ